jgi:hypothetical protein
MHRFTRRITKRTALLTLGLLAMLSAPLAMAAGEGRPLDGGARNPSSNPALDYTRETQIIADTSTYGTRQSNKSDNGGGAIYGCRSKAGGTPANNEPCLRVNNLSDGYAFEFQSSSGVLGGTITVGKGGDNVKPFTTNATGVATGLNADEVDGKSAEDLANADKLDGKDSADFAATGDLLFAAVTDSGTLGAKRGVDTAGLTDAAANTYTVTFAREVDTCSFTATQAGATATAQTFAVAPVAANKRQVTVDQQDDGALPGVGFFLQAVC